MRRFVLHQWIGMSVLGVTLLAGCRHCRRGDDCDCVCVEAVSPKVALAEPQTSPYSPMVLPAPKPTTTTTESAKPVVQPVVAQETKDEYESVLMTTIAPDASGAGSIAGTVSLTPAQAKAMGIRPGYTPGALAIPAKSHVASDPPAEIQAKPSGDDVVPAFPAAPEDGE